MSAYGGGGYLPDDVRIRREMEELMKVVDLETMSTKQFISALSERFGGVDLSARKKFIKATITEIIDSMERREGEGSEEDDSDEEESEEEESEEEEEPPPPPPRPKKKRSSGGGGGGGGSATGGLGAAKEISPQLADLLGSGRHMARTAVVKGLWDYIKEHNLQNPEDKREILLDARMKAVFGCDSFTMFSMNKYIGAHVEPYKPVDLSAPPSTSSKKRKAAGGAGAKGGDGKKKSPGLQAPWRLSDAMSAVTGRDVLPRPQVTQALWAYIRENGLQNPKDKREILCDDALSRVMGGQAKVTMFSMNKYITPHLLEKLDKSAYVHEDIDTRKEEEGDDGEGGSSDEE